MPISKELQAYINANKKIFDPYRKHNIELDPEKRWEAGTDHHPKSVELMEHIEKLDLCFNDDSFCWKTGGDGDNGESLMYLMDMYFELQDKLGL